MKQIIVITGTSSGFGTLMVRTFSNAGHTVIATMRNAATKNKEVAEELGKLPGVEVVELNVSDDASVNQGHCVHFGKIRQN